VKKKLILGVVLALVLASGALVPVTDTALAQNSNLSRSFSPDDQLLRDESFDVIVTFTAPADEFNSIGLVDNVPAGWAIQVGTSWCTPNAAFSNIAGDKVQYVWIGPYNSGQVFTAIYHVTVPGGASSGTHLFNGQLNYYIVRNGPFNEDIGGKTGVMVTAPVLKVVYTDLGVTPSIDVNDVDIDIKPGSDRNSLNVNSKGVLPVAILGTEDFDVMTIDPVSVVLWWRGITLPDGAEGVPPLRWDCEDVNRDGFMDIGLKYSMKAAGPFTVTRELPGDLIMMLMGNLMEEYGGTPIKGSDTVRIINKASDGP
jgi:hypothetical protein